jgi:hypothetical protein
MRAAARRLGMEHGTGGEEEGAITKMIESQTSKVPSGTYLTLGIGAMALSWLLLLAGQRNIANFVGQWVPTILVIGLYNKLVKLEGSE